VGKLKQLNLNMQAQSVCVCVGVSVDSCSSPITITYAFWLKLCGPSSYDLSRDINELHGCFEVVVSTTVLPQQQLVGWRQFLVQKLLTSA